MLNSDNITAQDIIDAGMTRKGLAEESGISYQTLSQRMCDFLEWPDEELKKVRHILAAHRRKLSATPQPR